MKLILSTASFMSARLKSRVALLASHVAVRASRVAVLAPRVAVLAMGACLFIVETGSAVENSGNKDVFEKAVLIRFEGPITPMLEQFLYRKLALAEQQGADLVILEIDSPGGFVVTTQNIADRLRDIPWARTVAFIPQEALSGAAIIALACDDILLAPAARLGDAGEIMMGEDNAFRYVPEKERSPLIRHVRDLAKATGRPPALAEAMVDMNLVVYHVRHQETGQETFLSDKEIAATDDPEHWEKIKPVFESRKEQFLTVNGERAVELTLAQGLANSREEVQAHYRLAGKPLVLVPTTVDTAVTILNFPLVTGVLFVIGLIALYFELSAPGLGIGGLIAGLCFALFFWSRFLGGTAGWLEVVLFAAGVVFVAVELFVIPGFGIAGFIGLLLMLASLLMASQHFFIPSSSLELKTTVNSLMVVSGALVAFMIAAVALSHYLGSIPVLSWMTLAPPTHTDDDGRKKNAAATAHRFLVDVGDWGLADSALRPAGKVRFDEAYIDVVTDGTFVEEGTQVQVIEISGNRVVVRAIRDESA